MILRRVRKLRKNEVIQALVDHPLGTDMMAGDYAIADGSGYVIDSNFNRWLCKRPYFEYFRIIISNTRKGDRVPIWNI